MSYCPQCAKYEREIAELSTAQQDAARYRWLRANAWLPEWAFSASSPDAEDAAIDAAIAKGGPTW